MLNRIFLAGSTSHFANTRETQAQLATHVTTEEVAKATSYGVELVFDNDTLSTIYTYENGRKQQRQPEAEEVGLPYQHYEPRPILLEYPDDENGPHQRGGEIPAGLHLLKNEQEIPFCYLGYIQHEDEQFAWLPFTLHLVYPAGLQYDALYVDYSDSTRPVIINEEEPEIVDEYKETTQLVFETSRFSYVEDEDFINAGNAGIPNWLQEPFIPTCPKSGRRMRFVCQIFGENLVEVEPDDEDLDEDALDGEDDWADREPVWGDVDLFVFFEPTSKVACYFTQST